MYCELVLMLCGVMRADVDARAWLLISFCLGSCSRWVMGGIRVVCSRIGTVVYSRGTDVMMYPPQRWTVWTRWNVGTQMTGRFFGFADLSGGEWRS